MLKRESIRCYAFASWFSIIIKIIIYPFGIHFITNDQIDVNVVSFLFILYFGYKITM